MKFSHLATTALSLDSALQWLWHSNRTGAVVTGDDRAAFALTSGAPIPLHADSASNLPIPQTLYDELLTDAWHGFQILPAADADLLRAFVFGPNYGHPVLHPPTGQRLRFRSALIELLDAELKQISKLRPKGPALSFAAHPSEPLLVYGDNAGAFHAHAFTATGFGKALKFAARERKASRVEFSSDGQHLFIAGMGYLAAYAYAQGNFTLLHELSIPVRDFALRGDRLFVNSGMHGASVYQHCPCGFKQLVAVTQQAVRDLVVSREGDRLAFTSQDAAAVSVYALAPI